MSKYQIGFYFNEFVSEDCCEEDSKGLICQYKIIGISPNVDAGGEYIYFVEFYINEKYKCYNVLSESEINKMILQFRANEKEYNIRY